MIATCIYCGFKIEHGIRHGATRADAHQSLIDHDRQCPKNPIAQELAVERERGDALAAHVERLRDVIENDSDPDRACSNAVQVLEERPLTSRVLRDSQVAAQTAQQIQWNVAADCVGHDELKPSTVLAWLSDYAAKYHRQAEGGEH